MKGQNWAVGLGTGFLSGFILRKIMKEPSITKMKVKRKKNQIYETGKRQYEDIQATKTKLLVEAQQNLKSERGNNTMENQNVNQTQTPAKRGNKKLPIAILTGAIVGGAFVLLKDPSERKRVKEGSRSTKDAVSGYASEVKEDPSAKKDDIVTRVRSVVNIVSEAAATVQDVFNNQGKEITEKVKDIKEESEEIVNTAKDAGEDLQEVGDKAKEAKSELKEDSQQEETSQQEEASVTQNKVETHTPR